MTWRRRRRVPVGFDQATVAQALAVPGIDPRQWISNALVVGGDEDEPVLFDEEDGQVYVQVQLEPSKLPVLCRLGASVAGDGEGDYTPFMVGDEVLVACPLGREDNGSVILCRLNNRRDKFPMESVAGQDPTTNTFGFRRRRTAFVEEYAGPVLLRSALSESFISIDEGGIVTIRGTDGVSMQMSPDTFQFQGPQSPTSAPEYILQMDMDGEHFLVQVKDAIICIGSSSADPDQNTITVPTAMTVGTAGNATAEHVLSTEAFTCLLGHITNILGTALIAAGAAPLTGVSLGAFFVDPVFSTTYIAPALPLAAAAPTAGYLAALQAAFPAAFQAQPQKVPVSAGTSPAPGIGCSGLLVG